MQVASLQIGGWRPGRVYHQVYAAICHKTPRYPAESHIKQKKRLLLRIRIDGSLHGINILLIVLQPSLGDFPLYVLPPPPSSLLLSPSLSFSPFLLLSSPSILMMEFK